MRQRRIAQMINMDDAERLARRRLPKAVYDAIAGGAGDEITMRANRLAYQERIWLRPRPLVDVSRCDSSTTVLGHKVSMPLMLAPTGIARMCDSEAENAVARAAGRAGTIFIVSNGSSEPFEKVMQSATGQLWFQMYIPSERSKAEQLLDRVAEAGYPVLCVTIDTAISAVDGRPLLKRERDIRNNLTIPLRVSPKLIATGLSRPLWTKDFLFGRVGRVAQGTGSGLFTARSAYSNLANVLSSMKTPGWDDIAWIRERWPGKLVIKGVMRGEEVPRMVDLGVDGIVVSNHGGRIQDGVRATIEVLPEVVAVAGGRVEVFVDGGVRRGSDVVKALALGARAVLVGRPYMWGLAVGGEKGVDTVLEFFQSELQRTMALCGLGTIADIDSSAVRVDFPL